LLDPWRQTAIGLVLVNRRQPEGSLENGETDIFSVQGDCLRLSLEELVEDFFNLLDGTTTVSL
jgi:hypothetical protein